jgi:putative ATP-binding cassette transporter
MAVTSSITASSPGFLRQTARLAGAYWNSDDKWKVRGQTFVLFFLTVVQVLLAVWINYWSRDLFDALENRQFELFLKLIGTFVLIFMLTIGVTALHLQVKRWLQLGWRKWLTERVVGHWMARGHHYQLLFTPGEHDNPDGRIADDIRIATESAVGLAHSLVYSLLILGSFIDILLSVTGSAPVPGTTVVVPGYMVLAAFAYAGVGTVFGLLLGRPLIDTTNHLQTAEASFRFGLAHARENSEAIAMMRGEPHEREQSSHLFRNVESGWNRQTLAYTWIVAFSTGYGALLPVFPILVAAPQFISGTMTLGVLMQAAQAFQKLTSALSWPIDNLGEMAKCRASADRVLSIFDDLLKLEHEIALPKTHRIHIEHSDESMLAIRALSLADSEGRILLEDFSAEFHRGERVLIGGDPAVTVALFKAIGGLWPWGCGDVRLPHGQAVVFLPQRPFLPNGSLEFVLSYPLAPRSHTQAELQHALECVGLSWLVPRLQQTDAWDRVLPLRAQQRLAFARLLLQRPCWVFLEEATDALAPKDELCLMEMLERELPNATIITISFHSGLEPLFQRKLVLNRLREVRLLDDDAASAAAPG